MILTWFSKTQKMARTRCPEDGIPIDPQLPQVLRASVTKNKLKTKWNKHVKMMVTLQKKKKILIEVLAITIQYPL